MNSLNNMLEDMKNNKPGNYYKGTIYNVVKQTTIQNEISKHIGDYDNIILYYNTSGPTIEIYMYNSPNRIDVNSSYRLSTYCSGWLIFARSNNTITSNQSFTNQTINGGRAYIDGNNNNQNYFAFTGITNGAISNVGSVRTQFLGWTNYVEVPPFKVTSTFEDVNVDNVQNKAFRLDYNQSFTKIGHIEDISDDTHFINITFSQVGGGLLLRNTLNMYNMFNSSEDFYIDENYDIYIRNRLLLYNIKYLLTADAYTDSTFETETGYYELNYYTITLNAVINGGVITSFGSGDYSIQNSINDTIDFYTDDSLVNTEIDSFFSGDTNSIVSNLNFPNLENNYFVVIYNVVAGISDTLQMSGDPYFDVSLHGETPKRIYASDFTTPPSVLKTFISMSLIFGTLYILYLQLNGFIMLLNTGHVKDAINQIDDISGNTLYKM